MALMPIGQIQVPTTNTPESFSQRTIITAPYSIGYWLFKFASIDFETTLFISHYLKNVCRPMVKYVGHQNTTDRIAPLRKTAFHFVSNRYCHTIDFLQKF